MIESRKGKVQTLAGKGDIEGLKGMFKSEYSQDEIDIALENAIAYSQIETANYLAGLGANISANDYNGVYYAVYNNELEGLKYAISKGVDINIDNGILLNTSIMASINTKNCRLAKWLLENGADAHLITKETFRLIEDWGNDELRFLIKSQMPLQRRP